MSLSIFSPFNSTEPTESTYQTELNEAYGLSTETLESKILEMNGKLICAKETCDATKASTEAAEAKLKLVFDKTAREYKEADANLKKLIEKMVRIKGAIISNMSHALIVKPPSIQTHNASVDGAEAQKALNILKHHVINICHQTTAELDTEALFMLHKQVQELSTQLLLKIMNTTNEQVQDQIVNYGNYTHHISALETAIKRDKELFRNVQSELIASRDDLFQLCVEPPQPTLAASEATEQANTVNSIKGYFDSVAQWLMPSPPKTGFEMRPDSVFHRLISQQHQLFNETKKSFQCYKTLESELMRVTQAQLLAELHQKKLLTQQSNFTAILKDKTNENKKQFFVDDTNVLAPSNACDYTQTLGYPLDNSNTGDLNWGSQWQSSDTNSLSSWPNGCNKPF